MIEKMKFLSITGPKADIDRVIDQYLSKYEIHLENALSELKTVTSLRPYLEINPYKSELQTANALINSFHDILPRSTDKKVSLDEAIQTVHDLDHALKELTSQKDALTKEADTINTSMNNVIPFTNLNYDVKDILKFDHVKFRFGRMTHEYYDKFMNYVYDTIDTVLHPCQEDADYVWLVYFVPETLSDKIDAIYASLHFERFFLADEYEGTPTEATHKLEHRLADLYEKVRSIDEQIAQTLDQHKENLVAACQKLTTYSTNFDVRKLAACTKQEDHTFYILCGWMSESDAAAFCKEIEQDGSTFCFVENDHGNIMSTPPTKLKNPGLFKPFEMFLQMYGLPAYDEIDPTIILGLTYSFLFGFMFGDAGQGLCLLLGGFLLYRAKKMNLAAIISCCGFFSTIFGFLFGSVFGFENIIEPIWLHPKEAMMHLPFIGNLNTVFVVAIAMGMGIVLMTMVLNVINSLRSHNTEKAYFDTNGIAGIVFYGALAVTIVLYMSGNTLPATFVLVVMFLVPLAVIFFKEPLTALVEKKAEVMPKEKGMFFVQGFFELFEVCLSYFSNTLSFVRVGAFAVSHAAMMEVVLMLAGAEAGTPNWVVIVLGNLFVCGMEGLIVGIQVLRLEYYELFSRFYKGTGRAFKPYGKTE
ncbi:MAG: V-type ATPase 116kDa subunit family protein [Lachnospiraceae bacterium]|nr:V-type ATPase 116kDa subunit family protein [Lachnospiraceae bacterium]